MGRRKKVRRRSNRLAVVAITAIVVVLVTTFSVLSYKLTEKNKSYALREAKLNVQLEEEKKRAEEIAQLKEYVQTDEYVEKAARDKLGMVYPDEILIRPEK